MNKTAKAVEMISSFENSFKLGFLLLAFLLLSAAIIYCIIKALSHKNKNADKIESRECWGSEQGDRDEEGEYRV